MHSVSFLGKSVWGRAGSALPVEWLESLVHEKHSSTSLIGIFRERATLFPFSDIV